MGPSSSVEKDKTDKARTSEIFSSVTTTQIQEFLSQKTALLKEQKALVWYLFLVWITDWYLCRSKFVEEDELIIYTSLVHKKKGLFSKKRQLILTDKPRFIFVEPDKLELKDSLPWNSFMKITPKTSKKFVIQTVYIYTRLFSYFLQQTETLYLEDHSGNAQVWAEASKKLLKEQRSTI